MSNAIIANTGASRPNLTRIEGSGGVLAVRAGSVVLSVTLSILDAFWRIVRWLWTTFILGGLVVSILISVATIGSPGVTDPSSWAVIQLILSYPEISAAVLGVSAFLTLCGLLAGFLRPTKPTPAESQRYILRPIRSLDSTDYVPSYQSIYLSRSDGDVDRSAQQALRTAALRKRRRGRKGQQDVIGICIFGRPTQGKTRLAWESMRAVLPGWTFLDWPHNSTERSLHRTVLRRRRIALWLDDLQKYDAETIRELKDLPRRFAQASARFVVVATCRDGADEVRVRQDLAGLLDRLAQFKLGNITNDEEQLLSVELKHSGARVEEHSFDGSPGSLILGLADMRRAYDSLRDDPKLILRSIKLLRSIGVYEYPPVHVLAAAGALGLFESRWIEARDALVQHRFIRLGPRDPSGQPSLDPLADAYVDDAVVYDFPVLGSRLSDFWLALQAQFEQRTDGSGLLALGNTYLKTVDAPAVQDASAGSSPDDPLARARGCYRAALRFTDRTVDPSTWARLHASLGMMLVREDRFIARASREDREKRVDTLEEAAKNFRQALLVTEESYPEGERVDANQQLISTLSLLRRLTRDGSKVPERLKEEIATHSDTLRVVGRDADPELWAETQRNIGVDYRGLAELEPGLKAARLDAAKSAYVKALAVFTREDYPLEWAELQLLLGNANWRRADGAHLPTRDRVLAEALTAYTNALTIFTREDSPIEWATAQFELARLHLRRATTAQASDQTEIEAELRRGKVCIDAAFTLLNLETFPDIYDEAQKTAADLDSRLRQVGVRAAVGSS